MADYQLVLRDPQGHYLSDLQGFHKLEYTLTVNSYGTLSVDVPYIYRDALFGPLGLIRDSRIEVNRTVANLPAYLEDEAVWFIRRSTRSDVPGTPIHIEAVHCNHLLKRRIIAYDAGTSQADKVGVAVGTAIFQIVSENLGSGAGNRALAANFFQMGAINGGIGTLTKYFARRNVLSALQEIADYSYGLDSLFGFVAMNIVSVSDTILEFRTYARQRGVDHRLNPTTGVNLLSIPHPVIMGSMYGNLIDPVLEFDSMDEITYAYAGGEGEEGSRVIGTAQDTSRLLVSPYNLIEEFVDARTTDDATSVGQEAESALRAGRPRVILTAKLADTEECLYGRDYRFGDYLTARFENDYFHMRLNALKVRVENGQEDIDGVMVSDPLDD